MNKLARYIEQITEIAKGFGLDFYPMRYEICPPDIIYTFGAYGMPTRYHHWSFGKAFHKMKLQYDLGMSKIYELVINSNPCYAFLLDSNTLIQNKLIVAHVLAHCDFFKNNAHFANTNRNMVDSMAASADRIRQYEKKLGRQKVESFLDAAMAIAEHIDPYSDRIKKQGKRTKPLKQQMSSYEDLWQLEPAVGDDVAPTIQIDPAPRSLRDVIKDVKPNRIVFDNEQEKDILLFIMENNKELEDWQRDILTIVRDEMSYFWPQMETKIMNEGWASYWHTRIIRELDLTGEEMIDFAKLNASVVQPSPTQINPYYLGIKIFEDIERRYGREKIFEVREMDSDLSFIRNYLTQEVVEETNLFSFGKQGSDYVINSTEWETVRDTLVQSRIHCGIPYISVTTQDQHLYLIHHYEGVELDLRHVEKTLPFVYELWGKDVYLETKIEDRNVLFSYDGEKVHRKFI
jgi:stage V sporulation protein R